MTPINIYELLRNVPDPKTGKDIVTAGMVQNLVIEGQNVNFTLALTSLQAPQKAELHMNSVLAIQKVFPQAEVNIHFAATAPTPREDDRLLPQVRHIIAVGSGKGGVGKSTVAVNLALGLKKLGARVGLLDADVYGPSIPTMMGLAGKRPMAKDVDGRPKMVPLEAYGIQTMSIGYIVEPEQAVVLRGPRLSAIVKQFCSDVLWDELDFMIIDLPPGTGDVQLTVVQSVPLSGAIIVTTPQEVAVADAIKAMNMFMLESIDIPIIGIVENMSWFTPAELPNNRYYLFGEGGGKRLSEMGKTPLLGQIPMVMGIREGGDSGIPAVMQNDSVLNEPFMKVAHAVLKAADLRGSSAAD